MMDAIEYRSLSTDELELRFPGCGFNKPITYIHPLETVEEVDGDVIAVPTIAGEILLAFVRKHIEDIKG